jgi:hypothetical protein
MTIYGQAWPARKLGAHSRFDMQRARALSLKKSLSEMGASAASAIVEPEGMAPAPRPDHTVLNRLPDAGSPRNVDKVRQRVEGGIVSWALPKRRPRLTGPASGLTIAMPPHRPCDHAFAFRISPAER